MKTADAMPIFSLWNIYMTPGAAAARNDGIDMLALLRRHASGDWGEMTQEDKEANNMALVSGARIFSAYDTCAGKIWIITESDSRETTTILTPDEY